VPESFPLGVLPLKGPLTETELLIVFTEFPPPELVVLCVTETEFACCCLPESGSGTGRDGMMGICDGLWAHKKVAESVRLRVKMRRLVRGGNCLKGTVGEAMLFISN
jgi:hypothetical protein